MNGNQLTAYAMTLTPNEARLICELKQYCVMPSYDEHYAQTGFNVYIWRAAIKEFCYIGRRSTYHAADNLIRKHIYRRLQRRAHVWCNLPLRRCPQCGLRCRFPDAYGDCYHCMEGSEYYPDDDPGFDPMFLM
jgi:hypothetical protein